MKIIKYLMLLILFLASTILGKILSKKYIERVEELEDIKNALSIFKNKIKFTYSPINEIFEEIGNNCNKKNIANIFTKSKENMKAISASKSWLEAVDNMSSKLNLNKEDIVKIKTLSKLLGISDIEGQINQIELTEELINTQIIKAQKEREKNETMYKKLGATMGLILVILLI